MSDFLAPGLLFGTEGTNRRATMRNAIADSKRSWRWDRMAKGLYYGNQPQKPAS